MYTKLKYYKYIVFFFIRIRFAWCHAGDVSCFNYYCSRRENEKRHVAPPDIFPMRVADLLSEETPVQLTERALPCATRISREKRILTLPSISDKSINPSWPCHVTKVFSSSCKKEFQKKNTLARFPLEARDRSSFMRKKNEWNFYF